MKKRTTMLTLLTAATLFLSGAGGSLKASAAEPVTYSVKYMAEEQAWEYRADTDEFENPDFYRSIYYMMATLKDGDLVAVYYDGSAPQDPTLDLGNVRLSNLTVAQSDGFSVIYAGYIDECFLLEGTSCAINSDINVAHAYDAVTCNFNKNVNELRLNFNDDNDIHSTIGCSGAVGHFLTISTNYAPYDLYNFQPDSFYLVNGLLQTPEDKYSKAPTQQPAPQQPSAPQATPTPPSGSASQPSSSEYDSVPKTGESSPVLWLFSIALFCGAGFCALKKSNKHL